MVITQLLRFIESDSTTYVTQDHLDFAAVVDSVISDNQCDMHRIIRYEIVFHVSTPDTF